MRGVIKRVKVLGLTGKRVVIKRIFPEAKKRRSAAQLKFERGELLNRLNHLEDLFRREKLPIRELIARKSEIDSIKRKLGMKPREVI